MAQTTRIGVDVGGTFTDLALHDEARGLAHTGKLPTTPDEPGRAIIEPRPGLRPVMAFLHAELADEEQLRGEFARVHVCRRFAMPI